jgi:hypothetical protein
MLKTIIFVTACSLTGWASSKICGQVTDFDDAVYTAPVEIIVSSNHTTQKAVDLDPRGNWCVDVDQGNYSVAVQNLPFDGFYRRAPIQVGETDSISLRIIPQFRIGVLGIKADGSEIKQSNPRRHYMEIEIPVNGNSMPALIEYEARSKSKRSTKFSHATFTISNWTVYARQMYWNPQKKELVLMGPAEFIKVFQGNEQMTPFGKGSRIKIAELILKPPS